MTQDDVAALLTAWVFMRDATGIAAQHRERIRRMIPGEHRPAKPKKRKTSAPAVKLTGEVSPPMKFPGLPYGMGPIF